MRDGRIEGEPDDAGRSGRSNGPGVAPRCATRSAGWCSERGRALSGRPAAVARPAARRLDLRPLGAGASRTGNSTAGRRCRWWRGCCSIYEVDRSKAARLGAGGGLGVVGGAGAWACVVAGRRDVRARCSSIGRAARCGGSWRPWWCCGWCWPRHGASAPAVAALARPLARGPDWQLCRWCRCRWFWRPRRRSIRRWTGRPADRPGRVCWVRRWWWWP